MKGQAFIVNEIPTPEGEKVRKRERERERERETDRQTDRDRETDRFCWVG